MYSPLRWRPIWRFEDRLYVARFTGPSDRASFLNGMSFSKMTTAVTQSLTAIGERPWCLADGIGAVGLIGYRFGWLRVPGVDGGSMATEDDCFAIGKRLDTADDMILDYYTVKRSAERHRCWKKAKKTQRKEH